MPLLASFENELEKLCSKYAKSEKRYKVEVLDSNYQKISSLLKAHGMAFSTRHSEGYDSEAQRRILWKYDTVPFSGIPFIHEKVSIMQCANGPKYYEQKRNPLIEVQQHVHGKSRRFRVQPSKKIGCSATMKIITITRYPQYNITDMETTKSEKAAKVEMMKRLKESLENDSTSVTTEIVHIISFSSSTEHCHSVWTTFMNQELDPALKAEIHKLVSKGITDIAIVKTMLKSYVEENIDNNISSTVRAFFPKKRIIRNHILKYIYANKQNKVDQIALKAKIDEWKKSDFLFCFQSHWQKELLNRYGAIVLLDSTYTTTKYALPLFSLVVKTNVSFIIVGIFVVQQETATAISEALQIFKEWKSNWNPTYFLTDYCEAEINAITRCFDCPVYICDFHRQQAWVRWFNKKDNIKNNDEKNILLSFFRKLAESKSTETFDNIEREMRDSNAWKNNTKVQKYYLSTWASVKEKWTKAFFDETFMFIISTNNGIESQHKVLKHFYLKGHIDKSLCGVLDVIINDFLNEAFQSYQISNASLDSQYKKYNSVIPEYLHDRPTFFIRHVYQRLTTAESIYLPLYCMFLDIHLVIFPMST